MPALVLSLLLVAAPVPRHLFPAPPPHPVGVGYRWYFGADVLIVHEVRGDLVTFRCLTDPARTWPRSTAEARATNRAAIGV